MNEVRLDPLTEGFLDYKAEVRKLRPGTLKDLRCTLRKIQASGTSDQEIWKWSLDDYLHWVGGARDLGYSKQSIQKQLSHVRGLLEYAWQTGRISRNPLDGFRLQDAESRKMPEVLTIDEARLLIQVCGRRTSRERRERMIVLLLYGCGLRTGEICRLDLRDVDRERQEIFIRLAKGDVQRRIPVPETVWVELLAYMLDRQGRKGALFVTDAKRRRIRQQDVLQSVRGAVERSGLRPGITPKTLRHSFATHLMDRGVDVGIIASLMGHRTPSETGVYLHSLPGRKEMAVESLEKKR